MIICPCHGCDMRSEGCHSECMPYKAYSQAMQDVNTKRKHSCMGRNGFTYDKYKHGDRCNGLTGRDDSNR